MGSKMNIIGVLTSGGDAPGMNSAVRAVVRGAIDMGMQVYGIRRGYAGLIEGDVIRMSEASVCDTISRGGTILYSARCPEFRTRAGLEKAAETCEELGLDGIVTIGGDGTFRGASDLSKLGIPCVGIPGTIDNDISCSEYTIGFDTAVNTVIESIDKIRDTAQSHNRCSIVEVMGNKTGYLALDAGIAAGATAIIVPELPYDFDADIIGRMKSTMQRGKHHFIIVVGEGISGTENLAARIKQTLNIDTKLTVLGHVQRGGSPSAKDRVVASSMGYAAANLLRNGIGDRVIAMKDGKIVDYDIQEALKMKKTIDIEKYRMSYAISIPGYEKFGLLYELAEVK